MADAYWRYGDARHQAAAASMGAPPPALKRPRPDYNDVPSGHEMLGYYSRDEERSGHRVLRDSDSIGASYDRYLRNGVSSYGGGEPVRSVPGGMSSHPVEDMRMLSVAGMDSRSAGYGSGRPELSLPPDASNTLFVEGLPANCTRREVSHIFRPFVGFTEVRLVNKESRLPGGDPLILCFVDFQTPAQATVALEALQGYWIIVWQKTIPQYKVCPNESWMFPSSSQSTVTTPTDDSKLQCSCISTIIMHILLHHESRFVRIMSNGQQKDHIHISRKWLVERDPLFLKEEL